MLEKLGIYNPFSGITTNQSEGFNTVLKHLQHWKEVPVDAIVLSLYRLQCFYYNEIQRGFCGLGTYIFEPKYAYLARPIDELQTITVYSPDEIVMRIREGNDVKHYDDSCKGNMDTTLNDESMLDDDNGDGDDDNTDFDVIQKSRAR